MTRRIFCKVLLVVVAVFGLLVLSGVLSAQGNRDWAFEHVKDVQERNIDRLMAMNGVEGTAIGYNQNNRLAIKVFTAGPGVRGIPQKLDGVPVQVVVTGKIYALADPTARFSRPVPIGVSTGHPDITAGTIGCRVKDEQGNVYALSNNHVYANSNNATLHDNVLQPGRVDGGVDPDDFIGTLFGFEPIEFSRRARNEIDAAIALSDTNLLGNATPADDPDGYGTPNSTIVEAFIGQQVQKFGRTTGLTQGEVTGVNATVRVGYGSGKTARFVKQIIIEPGGFSAGGDSGSLIVTDDDNLNPVGLLFAGSSTMTVANRIDLVLARFGVTVDGSEGPVDNPPVADFMGSPTSGDAPLTVNFTDLSTGEPTSWSWDFGDDVGTSTAQNPSYTYDTPGTYTVTLIATNAYGSDSEIKVDYITVSEAQAGDVVTITKAEYRLRNSELNVEAKSSEGSPDVILWVYGYDGEKNDYTVDYGQMTYDSRKGKYKLKIKSEVDPQGSVKVVSSLGGSATKTVKYK